MSGSYDLDLPAYYAAHLTAGLVDLSASSPSPAALSLNGLTMDGSFIPPSASPALCAAIAARYSTLAADDILICSGASEALAAVAFATLKAGSMVWAERSTYPSLLNAARHCGALVVAAGSPGEATLAVLTNPSVPFGAIRDTAAFIASALGAGAVPLVDEVYRDLVLQGEPPSAAADIHPLAVSVGDLSKPLGLGGLRIGWVATRDRDLLGRVDRELQLLSGGPSSLSVAAALQALETFDDPVQATLGAATSNSAAVYAVLARHRWSVCKPQAGLTAIATPAARISENALRRLEKTGYFLLPTSVFGVPGGFRVSLLADPSSLDHALGLLSKVRGTAPTRTVVVLTKAPGSGRAKTRLATTLGADATQRLARAFIADTLALATSQSWATVVALEPPSAASELRGLAGRARFIPQAAGDLGKRISDALGAAVLDGPALLIGSDTPDLPASILSEAFGALETHDAVLGPAVDGGFYLLGLRAPIADMFAGVEWSTRTVFERTARNIGMAGRSCAILGEWQDVDDVESLSCLAARLPGNACAPATRAVLESLVAGAPRGS